MPSIQRYALLRSTRVSLPVEQMVRLEKMETLLLKGLSQPVSVFNVLEGAPAEVIPLHPRGQQPR